MNQVILEHLVMGASSQSKLQLEITRTPLPSRADPVRLATEAHPEALTHSTSWRWHAGGIVLTFAHVYPDTHAAGMIDGSIVDADMVEAEPVACHAVRHLYFLQQTDQDIAALGGLDDFWSFAAEVVSHHHPAVAGLFPHEQASTTAHH